MPLFSNNFDAFGLDIGDRSLKAAYIKKLGATPRLVSYGSLALPDDVFDKGQINQPEVLAASIKKLVGNVHGRPITTAYVHACLPETRTFIKLLSLTSPEPGELPAKIREELPNHFPVSPDELYIDWQIVESAPGNNYKIVVGAVPRPIADSFTAALATAGLTPVSLQIEAQAVLRSLLPQHDWPRTPLAVIDIGATRSSFICFDQGSIQFTVSLSLAGDVITQIIADKLKLSAAEAEQAKIICGLDPNCGEGIVSAITGAAVDELAGEIKKNIAYYHEHFVHASPITSLILCGGGAYMKNLKETLTEKLSGLNVYIGNPLINLVKNFKSVMAKSSAQSSLNFLQPDVKFEPIKIPEPLPPSQAVTYTTAIGLALENIL